MWKDIIKDNVVSRVADPHHFNADTDPYPTFHFNGDPDPHRSDVNLGPPVYGPSVGLHFEPQRLCKRPRA